MSKLVSKPTFQDVLESIEVETTDPAVFTYVQNLFSIYANLLITDTELVLDTTTKSKIYDAQLRLIISTALVFTQMDFDFDRSRPKSETHDKSLLHALKDLDAYRGGTRLTRVQKNTMREFIRHAHDTNKAMSIDEIIDLAVFEDLLTEYGPGKSKAFQARLSSEKGARFLMTRHGVEATLPRIEALARRAEAANADAFNELAKETA